MDRITTGELAKLCGGNLLKGDPSVLVRGLSTDSRTIGQGEMFLALAGQRFDGHDFASAAVKRRAAGVIGERRKLSRLAENADRGVAIIGVGDTLEALHALARSYRSRFDIPLVAVAGSCGKTTTKDILGAILAQTHATLKTEGNLNNMIGAPLMLLRLDASIEAAVIEIASNAPGEIEQLARLLMPTAGIITNIAPVHLEGLHSVEGIFSEKCSLVPHISAGGFVVIGDDIAVERARPMFEGKILTFGLTESADFFASGIRQDIKEGAEFLLNGAQPVKIPLLGTHNVRNALAAIAAATELGSSIESIRDALAGFAGPGMRMQLSEFRGATIVNDAYNANPRAMREALSTIMGLRAKRRIVALGDMLELGECAREEHRALGHDIGRLRPNLLYLKGEFRFDIKEGAMEGGMRPEGIRCCADAAEIAASLRHALGPGDLVLVKGSRGMRMEEVIQLLEEE